jgi:peptidoglycan-associated lipoprotein
MKNATLFLVLAMSMAACSKDKPKTTPKPPDTAKTEPPAKKEDKPAPVVTNNDMVSPNIGVSGDILAACKLTVAKGTANPNFDYDKDDLMPEDKAVLEQVATCLSSGSLKGRSVELIGRADPRGTEEYNLGLGSRRSNTVGQYLTRLGVAQAQLGETTRGALDATGTDEAGWKKDRRVDIVLAAPKG